MTAAHRTLPFGTQTVRHQGCVMVRINDSRTLCAQRSYRFFSPAAARAIGLNQTRHVTLNR
jgi:rare lipoprotein A (peptidoglycan hydrolase)